jgi:hypothetical protein
MSTTEAEHADGPPPGMPPAFRVYDIDAIVYDPSGTVIAEWRDLQELWLEPPNICVRRTRELPDGTTVVYEDRGQLGQDFSISGTDGFGGTWSGRPLPQDQTLYTEGSGPKASFTMTNWIESQSEEHCLRVLDVHEPTVFLTDKPLEPGRYYIRTRDHLRSASNDVPESMKKPLAK